MVSREYRKGLFARLIMCVWDCIWSATTGLEIDCQSTESTLASGSERFSELNITTILPIDSDYRTIMNLLRVGNLLTRLVSASIGINHHTLMTTNASMWPEGRQVEWEASAGE